MYTMYNIKVRHMMLSLCNKSKYRNEKIKINNYVFW